MYQIACRVDAGVSDHGNDDRAFVNGKVISAGYLELNDAEYVSAGVCDGVSGESFGYEAAEIVANFMAERKPQQVSSELVTELVSSANALIKQKQMEDLSRWHMASTIAGIIVNGENMLAYNVGDSRVYRYRAPYIAQLTKDHSVAEELKSFEIEVNARQKHIITRCLGGGDARPSIFEGIGRSFDEDVYLICSDGISDVVSYEEFESVLHTADSLKVACDLIIQMAINNGSEDNLSIVISRRV